MIGETPDFPLFHNKNPKSIFYFWFKRKTKFDLVLYKDNCYIGSKCS